MRLPGSNQSRELSNNMTPMIDVVFLLIIFFLVSSHLARQESQIPLELPEATSHNPPNVETPALTVNVLTDGSWSVAGKRLDEASLASSLQEYLSRGGPEALVRVRVDQSVPYARVEKVLRTAAQTGLPNVSIAVYEAGAPAGGG